VEEELPRDAFKRGFEAEGGLGGGRQHRSKQDASKFEPHLCIYVGLKQSLF
jgi:hypothetical protein